MYYIPNLSQIRHVKNATCNIFCINFLQKLGASIKPLYVHEYTVFLYSNYPHCTIEITKYLCKKSITLSITKGAKLQLISNFKTQPHSLTVGMNCTRKCQCATQANWHGWLGCQVSTPALSRFLPSSVKSSMRFGITFENGILL